MPGAKKVITLSVSAALIASMFGIAGCGYRDNGNGVRTQNIRYGVTDTNRVNRFGVNSTDMRNRLNPNAVGNRNLDNMRYSAELSRRISEMKGIRNATVLVNDNSAYVAVSQEGQRGTNTSMRERATDLGNMGVRSITGTTGTTGITGTTGTRAPYTTSGIAPGLTGNNYGTAPRRSVADDNGLNGTSGTGTLGLMRGMVNNTNRNGYNGIMNGTDTGAYTGRNTTGIRPYSTGIGTDGRGLGTATGRGTTTGTGTALPSSVRNKVANKVKQYAPHIQKVYVSNDPDFVTRMGGYARDLGNGHPFSRMSHDFRMLTDRLFPTGTTGTDGFGPRPGTINRGNSTLSGNR
ncbi:YhcN/YlaJ family sporulation lipoprotein [Paenibacillus jiagnxiensis]|uniref:YhcN/YlaJ family sporulation lipoprotein n=1 Tax=Paenibacillus jiagnxiensis TaxID=3228926 RepID=UPI0033A74063